MIIQELKKEAVLEKFNSARESLKLYFIFSRLPMINREKISIILKKLISHQNGRISNAASRFYLFLFD